MPVEFLTDAQAAAFGLYVGPPSMAEMDRFFLLDDKALRLIEPKRLPHTRLGFAVQVTTLLFLGTFLTDPADVPTEVVDYLAEQLGIEDPSCVKAYRSREMTRLEHAREIRDAYGFVEFTPHVLRHTAGTTMTRAGVDRHPPYTRPRHVRAAELSITSAAAATSPCTRTAI